MKKLLFLLLLCAACTKESLEPQPCEINQLGNIRIQNFNADTYQVHIGNFIVSVDGNAHTDLLMMSAGTYRVKFTNQRTGGGSVIDDFEVEACVYNLLPIIF